jgi:hypothetical protein
MLVAGFPVLAGNPERVVAVLVEVIEIFTAVRLKRE